MIWILKVYGKEWTLVFLKKTTVMGAGFLGPYITRITRVCLQIQS